MPPLPSILARPNVPNLELPRTTPDQFGAQIYQGIGQIGAALEKQKDAQDVVAVQTALDKRDELYQQQQFEIKQDPTTYGQMDSQQFISAWNERSARDDGTLLQGLSDKVKAHGELLFHQLKRKEFNQQYDNYSATWRDMVRGKTIASKDGLVQKIAAAQSVGDETGAQLYQGQLNGLLAASHVSGAFKAEEIANISRDVNSDVETNRATTIMLDKQGGGPQQVIANIQSGMYPNIKPQIRDGLIANATRMAKQNENDAEREHRAHQEATYQTLLKMGNRGLLDQQGIRDAEESGDLSPTHVARLNSSVGVPAYSVSPGAVNLIMGERARNPDSLQNNNRARERLNRLDPKDPQVTTELERLKASDRMLMSNPGLAKEINDTVREFEASNYSGKMTVLQFFNLPGNQFMKGQRYLNTINNIHVNMTKGMSKQQALEQALKEARPAQGSATTPGQDVLKSIGE